jgi:hypothetical protein
MYWPGLRMTVGEVHFDKPPGADGDVIGSSRLEIVENKVSRCHSDHDRAPVSGDRALKNDRGAEE